MEIIDVISRIIHVGTAITLVGGSVFTAFVLMPSAKQLSDESHLQLAALVKSRWKRFVHVGILLFLISGLYNYVRAIPLHKGDGLYHALIGTKMILALVLFFIAAALVGRSEKLEPIRQNKEKWIKGLVLLAAIIVAMSGFVKVRGVPTSAATPSIAAPVDDVDVQQ